MNFCQSELRDMAIFSLASLRLAQSMYCPDMIDIEVIKYDLYHSEEFYSHFEKKRFSVLTISAFSWSWKKTMEICDRIKNKVGMIFIGGPETLNHSIKEVSGNVYLLYGEGESFFNELSKCLVNDEDIDDFIKFRSVKEITKNGVCIVGGDWKYSFQLFDEKFLRDIKINDLGKVLYYETTRGCAFSCGYCGYKYRNNQSGFLSPFVEDEIKSIGKLNVKKIFIVDPIMGGTVVGGMKIIKWFTRYAPHAEITAYMRPEYLNEEYIEILKDANLACLRFGLQTTNKKVPSEIRSNDMNSIRRYMPCLSKEGINWCCEIIVGLPGDNINGLKGTIKFVINTLHPTFIHSYRLMVVKDSLLQKALNSNEEKWIRICEINRYVTECYSYSQEELNYMLLYSELMVSLYNSYAKRKEYNNVKTVIVNESLSFEELNNIVVEIIDECSSINHGKELLKQRVKNDFSVSLEDFI